MKLEVYNLSCGYNRTALVSGINFALCSGEFLSLLGPNGAGKTTLFKTILGLLKPVGGNVLLGGVDITAMSAAQRARCIAYVPQSSELFFPYSAREIVLMGRSPWLGAFASPGARDHLIVDEALHQLSIAHLSSRSFVTLSSGEKQLVLIARALAQQSEYLLLDEPTSNLDFGNQVRILDAVINLKNSGKGILMTTHHPNQAFDAGGSVLLIDSSRSVFMGSAAMVLTEENLKRAYGIDVALNTCYLPEGNAITVCLPVFTSGGLQ